MPIVALFDQKHRQQMEENGEKLRQNLQRTVDKGSDGSLMGNLGLSFSKSLLNNLNNVKVKKVK